MYTHEPDETASQSKRKRAAVYIFSETQEMELAEFYKENELFYNKKLKDYKNSANKKRIMEEQAATLDPPCTCKYTIR